MRDEQELIRRIRNVQTVIDRLPNSAPDEVGSLAGHLRRTVRGLLDLFEPKPSFRFAYQVIEEGKPLLSGRFDDRDNAATVSRILMTRFSEGEEEPDPWLVYDWKSSDPMVADEWSTMRGHARKRLHGPEAHAIEAKLTVTEIERDRYRTALEHIATGGISPSITFAHMVLAGEPLLEAHRLDVGCKGRDPDATMRVKQVRAGHPLKPPRLPDGEPSSRESQSPIDYLIPEDAEIGDRCCPDHCGPGTVVEIKDGAMFIRLDKGGVVVETDLASLPTNRVLPRNSTSSDDAKDKPVLTNVKNHEPETSLRIESNERLPWATVYAAVLAAMMTDRDSKGALILAHRDAREEALEEADAAIQYMREREVAPARSPKKAKWAADFQAAGAAGPEALSAALAEQGIMWNP